MINFNIEKVSVTLLLKSGAKNNLKDIFDKTPLDHAEFRQSVEMKNLLSRTLAQIETTFAIDNVTRINAKPDLMAGYARKAGIAIAESINSPPMR